MPAKRLLSIFVIYYLLRGSSSLYIGRSQQRMKWKILHLDKELVMEATRNYERIQHFRRTYERFSTWPIGHILFTIRSRFGRMVRLYTLSLDNLHIYKHNQHIKHLAEMQKISMDIYALVEMIEDWDNRNQRKLAQEKEDYILATRSSRGLLRTARIQITKLPKKQAYYKKPSKDDVLGGRLNSNPLQIYDGGFASDIN